MASSPGSSSPGSPMDWEPETSPNVIHQSVLPFNASRRRPFDDIADGTEPMSRHETPQFVPERPTPAQARSPPTNASWVEDKLRRVRVVTLYIWNAVTTAADGAGAIVGYKRARRDIPIASRSSPTSRIFRQNRPTPTGHTSTTPITPRNYRQTANARAIDADNAARAQHFAFNPAIPLVSQMPCTYPDSPLGSPNSRPLEQLNAIVEPSGPIQVEKFNPPMHLLADAKPESTLLSQTVISNELLDDSPQSGGALSPTEQRALAQGLASRTTSRALGTNQRSCLTELNTIYTTAERARMRKRPMRQATRAPLLHVQRNSVAASSKPRGILRPGRPAPVAPKAQRFSLGHISRLPGLVTSAFARERPPPQSALETPAQHRRTVAFAESPRTGRPVTGTKRYVIGEAIDYPSPVSSRDESSVLSLRSNVSMDASSAVPVNDDEAASMQLQFDYYQQQITPRIDVQSAYQEDTLQGRIANPLSDMRDMSFESTSDSSRYVSSSNIGNGSSPEQSTTPINTQGRISPPMSGNRESSSESIKDSLSSFSSPHDGNGSSPSPSSEHVGQQSTENTRASEQDIAMKDDDTESQVEGNKDALVAENSALLAKEGEDDVFVEEQHAEPKNENGDDASVDEHVSGLKPSEEEGIFTEGLKMEPKKEELNDVFGGEGLNIVRRRRTRQSERTQCTESSKSSKSTTLTTLEDIESIEGSKNIESTESSQPTESRASSPDLLTAVSGLVISPSTDHSPSERRVSARQVEKAAEEAAEQARLAQVELQRQEQAKKDAEEKAYQEGIRRMPKEMIIQPLTAEADAAVADALKKRQGAEVARTTEGNTISRRDIGKILPQPGTPDDPSGWLNDEAISAYLLMVTEYGHQKASHNRGDKPKFHAFNAFFYTNLQDKGYEAGVKRWAKKAKIGGKDLLEVEWVFIPVNKGGNHWTLAVVSPKRKLIEYFDSLHGASRGVITNIKAWLQGELGAAYKEEEWKIREQEEFKGKGGGPTQDNAKDCGVFTVTTAKMIVLGVDPMAVEAADMPLQRRRMVAEILNGGFTGAFEPKVEFV